MPTYKLYIKSHNDNPDFWVDISAENKREAINKIWNEEWEETGWDKIELKKYLTKI